MIDSYGFIVSVFVPSFSFSPFYFIFIYLFRPFRRCMEMAVKFEVVAASPRLARNAAQIILCKLCGAAASWTIQQCMSVAHYVLFNPKACNCYQSSLEEKCKNIQ